MPFPAGGGVDAVARIVAEKLGSGLGQQVIIDNRGGVAGVIGMRVAAKSAPDGTTIVMTHTGITSINPTGAGSNWCGAAGIAKLSADLTAMTNLK